MKVSWLRLGKIAFVFAAVSLFCFTFLMLPQRTSEPQILLLERSSRRRPIPSNFRQRPIAIQPEEPPPPNLGHGLSKVSGSACLPPKLKLPPPRRTRKDVPKKDLYLEAGCIPFHCDATSEKCSQPHSLDHASDILPCCADLLREMLIDLVNFFTLNEFGYYATMGTLLGIVRNDYVIPWTADQDLVVDRPDLARFRFDDCRALLQQETGLVHLFEGVDRVCVGPSWRNGFLKRWEDKNVSVINIYREIYHYIDLYAQTISSGRKGTVYRIVNFPCEFSPQIMVPYEIRLVYNKTLAIALPRDANAYLDHVYGNSWKTPDTTHDRNGHNHCASRVKKRPSMIPH